MSKTLKNIDNIIGNTPLKQLQDNIYAKLEFKNPTGSTKDRVALQMLNDANLKAGSTVIEPTSGNTGIALAALCASRGFKCIIVMPKTMSIERQQMIKSYGAEIVLAEDMADSVDIANKLYAEIPNSFVPNQFSNPSNWKAHIKTGEEILEQINPDCFVAGVGTGGTITGVAKVLTSAHIVAVEPKSSAVLSGGEAGPHAIQGIGAGFIPDVLDTKVIDEIIQVSDEDAITSAKKLKDDFGLFVGISSGAAYFAAKQLDFKRIVVLFPDSGDRYLSVYEN